MKNGIEWGILKPDEANDKKETIPEIFQAGDVDQAIKTLQDAKLLRTLTLNRGEGGENFKFIQELLNIVIKEKYGPEADYFNIEGEKLVSLLHEYKIPEQVLGELLSGSFHLRDQARFFHTYALIMENYQELNNEDLVNYADHDMASWYSTVEGEKEKATNLNKKVFDDAKTKDLKIIATKAKFGITANKNLKPKDRASGFGEISAQMESLEHYYDAKRAKLEEVKALVELAEKQTDKNSQSELEENLERAINLIKDVYEYAREHSYANLEILAQGCQASVAKAMGEERRAKQFFDKSLKLKEKYGKVI